MDHAAPGVANAGRASPAPPNFNVENIAVWDLRNYFREKAPGEKIKKYTSTLKFGGRGRRVKNTATYFYGFVFNLRTYFRQQYLQTFVSPEKTPMQKNPVGAKSPQDCKHNGRKNAII